MVHEPFDEVFKVYKNVAKMLLKTPAANHTPDKFPFRIIVRMSHKLPKLFFKNKRS